MPTRWIYDEVSNTWSGDFNAPESATEDRPNWLPWPYTVKQIPKMKTRDLREVYYSFLRSDRNGYESDASAHRAWNRELKKRFPDMEPFKICAECSAPAAHVGLMEPRPGHFVDPECYAARWRQCPHCNEHVPRREMRATGEGEYVCNGCIERENYALCEHCNAYWHPNTGHNHPQCCESPQQLFTLRNDGEEPLANDTRVTVQMAEKRIDNEGIRRIYDLIRSRDNAMEIRQTANAVLEMDPRWQMKTGNFTKRLQSNIWKTYKVKLPPEIVSEVGNIAARHTAKTGSFDIEITRNLNLPARHFGNPGSCWWGGYSNSRCALKTNGGFGIRTFSKDNAVTGRCWVVPLKYNKNAIRNSEKFKQTFNTMEADAFFVFNGYGELADYAPARLMAHMQGVTYKKVAFVPGGEGWYINNGSGFLVAPEDVIQKIDTLEISVMRHSDLYQRENR